MKKGIRPKARPNPKITTTLPIFSHRVPVPDSSSCPRAKLNKDELSILVL